MVQIISVLYQKFVPNEPFLHGTHLEFKIGDCIKIFHAKDDNSQHDGYDVTVVDINEQLDFILLKSMFNVVAQSPRLTSVEESESFLLAGFGNKSTEEQQLGYSNGVVYSKQGYFFSINDRPNIVMGPFMLGTVQSSRGDSGGACWSANGLIGINFGVTTMPETSHSFAITFTPKNIISPSIPFISMALMAQLRMEKHNPVTPPEKKRKPDKEDENNFLPLQILERYLEKFQEVGDIKCCFTIISSHYAISFNHGHHQDWRSSPVENQTTVTICNQDGKKFETKVIECDAEIDLIVVHSEVPLVSKLPVIGIPRKLERYILLSYPNVDSSYQALEGVFSSIERDDEGRMRGSSGSRRGYSGGPIFNYKGELLGINVANESSEKFIGFNGKSSINEIVNEMNVTFPFLSVIVPAYCIAFKYHKDCKFTQ